MRYLYISYVAQELCKQHLRLPAGPQRGVYTWYLCNWTRIVIKCYKLGIILLIISNVGQPGFPLIAAQQKVFEQIYHRKCWFLRQCSFCWHTIVYNMGIFNWYLLLAKLPCRCFQNFQVFCMATWTPS